MNQMAIDMTLVVQVLVAALIGVFYTIMYKYANIANSLETVDWTDVIANVIFGAGAAVVCSIMGITFTGDVLVQMFTTYAAIVVMLHLVVQNIKEYFLTKVTFYTYNEGTERYQVAPKKVNLPRMSLGIAIRKMTATTKNFMVFDLPIKDQEPTLACVEAAEAANDGKGTYQYAIQSGAWVFLVEGGVLTGSVHYWYKQWNGAAITWKAISDACLTQIRNTGRFVSYNALY